ncbi:MAG: Na+/H+ antiporter subunit E [Candidatus Krumholzibacteria bacterium]|nr:Na+/H+ antiporter subunit E [Candidatus Krumholzibacteria bacterium]
MEKFLARLLLAALLVLIYIVWTGSTDGSDVAVMSAAALLVSAFFSKSRRMPRITPVKVAWSIAYVFYLFVAIIKANFDVASRIVRRKIPLNPGIVSVRTRLTSPLGRIVLANSITLTPGTLSVEMKGDILYVHWIDVATTDREEATEEIVAGFEKYLEVIFG